MLVKSVFLDESGNSGDLISRKNGLGFANQPVFSLAAVDISGIQGFDDKVIYLKDKFGIKADELKSSDIYKKKPHFCLNYFRFWLTKKHHFLLRWLIRNIT